VPAENEDGAGEADSSSPSEFTSELEQGRPVVGARVRARVGAACRWSSAFLLPLRAGVLQI
jgi:hypothetical protein